MTKAEQAKLVAWRLKILQYADQSGTVTQACRYFGTSRKTFYMEASVCGPGSRGPV